MRTFGAAAFAGMLTTGCSNAPSVNLLGAYFPDWLFCIVVAVLLTVAFRLVLQRLNYERWLGAPAVFYLALVTFLSLAAWLSFFQH
ncbi:hypothetical protein AYM40_07305 [Paraburkholderia phytofirmans OLGA172]|uniref:Uncharacterized protein YtcA n=1 Tax=Paraburkholderia phytofirmans OLGA172 TaxID=1417228 RepID=A0A160FIV8_9BURK|nr:YtcA family lipoprotein [Paraburkholderia phytofirmans]ANB72191.1 hypothetical protein AYM40_07305 [Paraburkholderia phytofirmans OLGA172]